MQLDHLNGPQRDAVTAEDRALLVLAGAGSGKTRVLTTRIAYLISDRGVAPWEVIAFTFTNKAAAEMKSRVEGLLGQEADGMWIGTFHSLGARILRREIEPLGWRRDFTIYDTGDQRTLVKGILKDLGVSNDLRPQQALAQISDWKNHDVSPEAAEESAGSADRVYAKVYARYEKAKKQNNALDFDDLILKTLEVLRDDAVRERYQRQFAHVFVDEYQDTNSAQYEMVRRIAGTRASVCVVGDADQSIYGWRGADIQNILRFEQDFPGARTILLEQNYRSTQHILDAANTLIAHNAERKKKNLWTDNGAGDEVVVRRTQSEHEEAIVVCAKVKEEMERGVKPDDIAILYRTNAQSRPFEEVFLREGIPYRVIGGLKFYDRAEIKDLIAYMNLAVNPLDDVAFRRVVNQPKRGIGDATVDALARVAAEKGQSLLKALMDDDTVDRMTKHQWSRLWPFRRIMQNISWKTDGSILDFAESVYQESGIERMLQESSSVEDKTRMENIGAFLDAVASYEQEEPEASITDYLQNLALLSDRDKTDEKGGVNLLTIHSAKGLEFPVVFVVGLEEGLFPSSRTVEEGNVEEERRLFYVAMTRAEKRLYLSHADSRHVFGQLQAAMPSRFLEEIADMVKEDETSSVLVRENVYDRNYAQRSASADPRLRAEYDQQREQFLRSVKERTPAEATKALSLRVGDKIKHKKFGTGTVVSVVPNDKGDELTVAFDGKGLKRLNAALAPIQKL
ncbi:MAG: 3'-5' exonuclease [Peptoniphilaceae bacterium]|nr:3'-5' exonuclease [Peptoniphilaceae bacterium]MDY6085824.1 3'-5' exonuclease [Peptoniphilaceae bacterium]